MKIHTFFNLQKIGGSLRNATPQTVNLKSFAARTPQCKKQSPKAKLPNFENFEFFISC